MSALQTADLSSPALLEHLPAPGSELYYALLYQPAGTRPALTLIEAFRRTISAIPLGSSNAEITHTRLAWWHEELHSLEGTAARHPLLRALHPLVRIHPTLLAAMFSLVEGVARQLAHPRYAEADERHALLRECHGPLWRVHGDLCGVHGETDLQHLVELGVLTELAWLLRDLRRAITGGLSVLCRDHEPASGTPADDETFYRECLQRELASLLEALGSTRARFTQRPLRARDLRCLRTLALLAERTLQEVLADGADAWCRRLELTPLRKLLLALRVRVSA
ncbi:MAG: hypothetical protein RL434_1364 [Pseudomonadota bacterium]|jgi:phytoene/squalene synthetase